MENSAGVSQAAYSRRLSLPTYLGSKSSQSWASGGIADLPASLKRLSEDAESGFLWNLIGAVNGSMALTVTENYVSDRSGERLALTPDHWVVVGANHARGLETALGENGCDTSYIEYSGKQDMSKSKAVAIELEMKMRQLGEMGKRHIVIVYQLLDSVLHEQD